MGAANEAIPELVNSNNEVVRGLGNFSPSLWGDRFSSFSFHQSEYEAFDDDILVLKEQVRRMLIDPAITSTKKIYLIYHLHRLGLSYHFENEVDGQLGKLFTNLNLEDCDLYSVSLQFQVFREHGYKLPCDVFNKFTDDTGHFKETLSRDVRGLLSLYQACQLRIRGEEILENALAFATAHLNDLPTELIDPRLVKQVTQALRQPFHKGMPRIEAGLYISIYEQEESRNESLLKLAKMDFNKLRLLHLKELGVVSKWWNDLEIATTLHYVRDRVVESYFWILGVTFEPRYSLERIIYAKLTALLVILDDTYDAYGTIDELQLFTDAVDRWDVSAMDQLPNYMKYIYTILLALYDELDEQMTKEGREYATFYAKEALKELLQEYYRDAVWSTNGIIPPFDEYLESATVSSGYYVMSVNGFTGMGTEVATKDAFEWLQSRPKILKAAETIARLQNDIMSHEIEEKRGQFASAVESYMRLYDASKKETIIELWARIENAWKDINEEYLKPTAVSKDLLMVLVNLARVIDVIYKYGDGLTKPKELQDYITLLFDKPMVV